MLRNGVCSWTDKSLIDCGKLYTKKGNSTFYLETYSSRLSCVEVDASTYTIPTKERVTKWCSATPEGFIFSFKAHQIFTHQRTEYNKLPRVIRDTFAHPQGPQAVELSLEEIPIPIQEQLMFLFNLALRQVYSCGKLGVVVFQFPESFQCSNVSKALITKLRSWLDKDFTMGLELRSKSWFFDANDLANLKASGSAEPETTAEPKSNRMREIEDFVRTLNRTTLIAIDEYIKRDAIPTLANPHPARVTPIVTQCIGDDLYIRVHRRVGEHRKLSNQELLDWSNRLQQMNPKPQRVFLMWNTNFEMQAFENAANLERQMPPDLVFNWKEHYMAAKKADKSSIFSFFGAAEKPSPKKKNEEEEEEEEEERTPPLPRKVAPVPPSPKSLPKQPTPKKRQKTAGKGGAVAAGLAKQQFASFFKPKE